MIEAMATIFILAAVVEAILTYVMPKKGEYDEPREWVKYVSAVLGVVICVAYQADMLAVMGVVSPIPYVGAVITGLIVGRGSNFLNDFYSGVKKPAQG